MQQEKRIYRSVKYEYDSSELRKLGEELAAEVARANEIDIQKKTLTASLNAELKTANAHIIELARKVSAGHEYRNVECDVILDMPVKGRKQFIDLRTGLVVGDDEEMTQADRQLSLGE